MSLSRSVVSVVGAVVALGFSASILGAQVAAQEASRGSVVGVVKEGSTGQPLAGVQVRLSGTSLGTMTSADGRFVIPNIRPSIYNIEVMRIGYTASRVDNVNVVEGRATTVPDILMTSNPMRLQTVVTSGVSDPTAGVKVPFVVATINPEDMPVPAIGSTAALLKGRVAGVQVRPASQPGQGTQIQLRNPMSVRGDTRPLFIVDGVIMVDFDEDRPTSAMQADSNNSVTNNMNSGLTPDMEIDPSEIASIEIIKGAAAAALYGAKAANGVISITTNRGQSIPQGTARYTARSEAGFQQLGRQVPVTMRHNYLMDQNGQYINLLGQPVTTRAARVVDPNGYWDNDFPGVIYNHTDQLFGRGSTFNNQLTIGQSTLATNFLATAGANSQTGVIRDAKGQDRKNIRLNIDHRAGDRFSIQVGAGYTRTFTNRLIGSEADIFEDFLRLDPDVDLLARTPDGRYVINPDPDTDVVNPLYTETIWTDNENRGGIQSNISANYRMSRFLSLSGTLGYQRVDRMLNTQIDPGTIENINDQEVSVGQIRRTADFTEGLNGNLGLSAVTQWGDLNMRARVQVAGELSEGRDFSIAADSANVNAPDIDYYRWTRGNGDDRFETRSKSLLLTDALEYRGRYIVEGLWRLDGSSAYGEADQWQDNARISAAWRMAEEPWWPVRGITEAKLRYSIGSAANNPQFDDRFQLFTFAADGRIQKNSAGNLDLVPETVIEQEMGLDLSIADRFGVELTYARQVSHDLLRASEVLAYSGFSDQVQNVGTIKGQTFEATFEAHWFDDRNFRWNSTLVADRSRAKITEMRREDCPDGTVKWCVGTTFGEIFTRHFITSFDELPAVSRNPASRAFFDINDEGLVVAVGPNGSWRDQRWGQTMVIDGMTYGWGLPIRMREENRDELRVKTQTLPKMNLGLSNTWTIKQAFSVYALINGQIGGKNMNGTKHSLTARSVHAIIDQAGKPDYRKKPLSYYIGAYASGTGPSLGVAGSTNWNDYFFEDATFAKLEEVMFAYTVPGTVPVLNRLGLERGRIALIGRNLFTLTGYSGYDPEVQNTTNRYDQLSYPRFRTYSAQLEFIF